jgi:hypothetical protein
VGPQVRNLFIDDMLTTIFKAMRKRLGTRFVWCQLTPMRISGKKTTRNWLRTCCHCTMSQTWLRYVLKDTHASFPFGFLPQQLQHGYWRARWTLSSGNCNDGKKVSGKVAHFYVGWLLLDARQKCPWAATQATGKAKSQVEAAFYRYMCDVHISEICNKRLRIS